MVLSVIKSSHMKGLVFFAIIRCMHQWFHVYDRKGSSRTSWRLEHYSFFSQFSLQLSLLFKLCVVLTLLLSIVLPLMPASALSHSIFLWCPLYASFYWINLEAASSPCLSSVSCDCQKFFKLMHVHFQNKTASTLSHDDSSASLLRSWPWLMFSLHWITFIDRLLVSKWSGHDVNFSGPCRSHICLLDSLCTKRPNLEMEPKYLVKTDVQLNQRL